MSVLEVLVAFGITAGAILLVIGLCLSILRGGRKSIDVSAGAVVADRVLTETVYNVQNDVPAGSKANFWGSDYTSSPWLSSKLTMNRTDFAYQIYAQTLLDSSGNPLGASSLSSNRIKRVTVEVYWWDAASGDRAGYGRLRTESTRLVTEAP